MSKELAERGFDIDKVDNDPSSRKAPAIAEVRHGPAGKAQAALLRTALPNGTTVVQDKRKGATIDVALGAKWTRPAPIRTTDALPMCPAPTES